MALSIHNHFKHAEGALTTVGWPLDDIGLQSAPTWSLPHSLGFQDCQVSHSKQTARRLSSAWALTTAFCGLNCNRNFQE